MKKSEKLLEAIGQIDDKLVAEAAKGEITPGRRRKKKAVLLRWQGALAACALLAVCIGVFGMLDRMGVLQPFTGGYREKQAEGIAMDAAGASPQEAAEECAEDAAESPALSDNPAEPEVLSQMPQAADESGAERAGNDGQKNAGPEKDRQNDLPEKEQSISGRSALVEQQEEEGQDTGEPGQGTGKQESCQVTEMGFAPVTAMLLGDSTQSLRYVLTNHTEQTILLQEGYELECMSDGRWETVKPQATESREPSEIPVQKGESREETISFHDMYGDLASGTYRIVKSYRIENAPEEMGICNTYLEFSVSP